MEELVERLVAKAGFYDAGFADAGFADDMVRELFRFGSDIVGADLVGEIIAGTPGISRFA